VFIGAGAVDQRKGRTLDAVRKKTGRVRFVLERRT
jgi:hypothetical protein